MKRLKLFLKKTYKVFIGIIIGAIITSTGVYAATAIAGTNVEYNNTNSKLSATTVQGAIDEIHEKYKVVKSSSGLEVKTCNESNCAKCVRATVLHKETCSNKDTSGFCQADGYSVGSTITYGNLGTSGKLSTGDAFDCDVNGDKTYDAATERFYYVTDMDANTAVLIYYNNVSGGVASNSTSYVYDSSGANNNGPVTVIEQLPTTTQWSNVSLTNTTRAITNESGGSTTSAGNLPTAFSYARYAARLITYQEVNAGCFDGTRTITSRGGLSNKCKFLMENTKYSNSSITTYGGWFETPVASESNSAWSVLSYGYYVYNRPVLNTSDFGVRPAIEVLKSNISY